jgi:hypothetical protein
MVSKKWHAFSDKSPDHNRIRLDLESIRRHLNHALALSEGIDFGDEHRELIVEELRRFRTRLDELQQAIERAK